ncbi:hypothetical protein PA598K_05076 [Paenibacillus sp. 598K]|nr:hypothetical protein PA598K_05076 [Paenibacillus sp. 598K]
MDSVSNRWRRPGHPQPGILLRYLWLLFSESQRGTLQRREPARGGAISGRKVRWITQRAGGYFTESIVSGRKEEHDDNNE